MTPTSYQGFDHRELPAAGLPLTLGPAAKAATMAASAAAATAASAASSWMWVEEKSCESWNRHIYIIYCFGVLMKEFFTNQFPSNKAFFMDYHVGTEGYQ